MTDVLDPTRTAAIQARLAQAHAEVHAMRRWPAQFALSRPRHLREWQDVFRDAAAALAVGPESHR